MKKVAIVAVVVGVLFMVSLAVAQVKAVVKIVDNANQRGIVNTK